MSVFFKSNLHDKALRKLVDITRLAKRFKCVLKAEAGNLKLDIKGFTH